MPLCLSDLKVLRESLKEDFAVNFPKYKTYALTLEGEPALLYHLDGRCYLTDATRKELNFKASPV